MGSEVTQRLTSVHMGKCPGTSTSVRWSLPWESIGKRNWVDVWSLAHAAWGAVARLLRLPLWLFVVVHEIFELWENTCGGIRFYRGETPLGRATGQHNKDYTGDSVPNSICDLLFGMAGWALVNWIIGWFPRYDAQFRVALRPL